MSNGTVKWFNNAKGFGFITDDNGAGDVFVNFSSIQSTSRKILVKGQKVIYIAENDPKDLSWPRAKNVWTV